VAFDQIALELERAGPIAESLQLSLGQVEGSTSIQDRAQGLSEATNIALNIFQQPFATLASLAANVELYFQGLLYRGYFTEFTVDENGDQPGLFDYNLSFTAHSRQGIRRNFMPWHRQPFNPIGGSSGKPNPLSYVPLGQQPIDFRESETFVDQIASTALDVVRGRSTSSGSGNQGGSLTGENLEDLA
jgi:hypothetical protein